jgi:hypothetical protein
MFSIVNAFTPFPGSSVVDPDDFRLDRDPTCQIVWIQSYTVHILYQDFALRIFSLKITCETYV